MGAVHPLANLPVSAEFPKKSPHGEPEIPWDRGTSINGTPNSEGLSLFNLKVSTSAV